MVESVLAKELTAMMAEQQDMIRRTGGGSLGAASLEVKREQREMFVKHGDCLERILTQHGWPTAAKVGPQAARGAWLVAQHADTQIHVQRLAVQLMRAAVADGEAAPRDLAFLEDRLAVNEGRFQNYGTQIADVVNGQPIPWPCTEPDRLDERRAQVGIESFAENAARYLNPAQPLDSGVG